MESKYVSWIFWEYCLRRSRFKLTSILGFSSDLEILLSAKNMIFNRAVATTQWLEFYLPITSTNHPCKSQVSYTILNRERNISRLYTVTMLIQLICRLHHEKHWAGWSTSWNQDCWEKYQELQICRWHHLYCRKQRGTEEPLESEKAEWKIWVKLIIQKTKIMPCISYLLSKWNIFSICIQFFIQSSGKLLTNVYLSTYTTATWQLYW